MLLTLVPRRVVQIWSQIIRVGPVLRLSTTLSTTLDLRIWSASFVRLVSALIPLWAQKSWMLVLNYDRFMRLTVLRLERNLLLTLLLSICYTRGVLAQRKGSRNMSRVGRHLVSRSREMWVKLTLLHRTRLTMSRLVFSLLLSQIMIPISFLACLVMRLVKVRVVRAAGQLLGRPLVQCRTSLGLAHLLAPS